MDILSKCCVIFIPSNLFNIYLKEFTVYDSGEFIKHLSTYMCVTFLGLDLLKTVYGGFIRYWSEKEVGTTFG